MTVSLAVMRDAVVERRTASWKESPAHALLRASRVVSGKRNPQPKKEDEPEQLNAPLSPHW